MLHSNDTINRKQTEWSHNNVDEGPAKTHSAESINRRRGKNWIWISRKKKIAQGIRNSMGAAKVAFIGRMNTCETKKKRIGYDGMTTGWPSNPIKCAAPALSAHKPKHHRQSLVCTASRYVRLASMTSQMAQHGQTASYEEPRSPITMEEDAEGMNGMRMHSHSNKRKSRQNPNHSQRHSLFLVTSFEVSDCTRPQLPSHMHSKRRKRYAYFHDARWASINAISPLKIYQPHVVFKFNHRSRDGKWKRLMAPWINGWSRAEHTIYII